MYVVRSARIKRIHVQGKHDTSRGYKSEWCGGRKGSWLFEGEAIGGWEHETSLVQCPALRGARSLREYVPAVLGRDGIWRWIFTSIDGNTYHIVMPSGPASTCLDTSRQDTLRTHEDGLEIRPKRLRKGMEICTYRVSSVKLVRASAFNEIEKVIGPASFGNLARWGGVSHFWENHNSVAYRQKKHTGDYWLWVFNVTGVDWNDAK